MPSISGGGFMPASSRNVGARSILVTVACIKSNNNYSGGGGSTSSINSKLV